MVFFFRDKSFANIFFLLLLSLAVHIHFFTTPPVVVITNNQGLITNFLIRFIKPLPTSLLFLFYHLLILLQALRLNTILNNLKMYHQQHFTVAMAYILFSGFFTQWCAITPALLANSLVILIFLLLAKMYNHPSPKTLLFNIGLLSSITILCFHPTSILVGITLFALTIVRAFKLAEWFVLLMGIALPFYFLASYLFLTDNLGQLQNYLPILQFHLPVQQSSAVLWLSIALLLIISLAGLYYNQLNSGRMVIQIRKNWGVMMVLLVLMLPIPFIFKGVGMESAVLSLIPLAAFAANAYSYPKRLFLPNILFWLSVALIVYNNWLIVKN